MKKINWKIANSVLWIELLLCYILPFKTVDNFEYKIGFPYRFISVYDTAIGINPLTSMGVNIAGLLLNVIILYVTISILMKVYRKIRAKVIRPNVEMENIVNPKA